MLMGARPVLSTGARWRVAIAVIALLVNAAHGGSPGVLPWILLVLAFDVAAGATLSARGMREQDRRLAAYALTVAGAVAAGLALVVGPGALLAGLIPLLRAWEEWGRRGIFVCLPSYLIPAAAAWTTFMGGLADLRLETLLPWLGIAVSLGALALWSERLAPRPERDDALADEAAWLLSRLDGLAGEMRAGFDPATTAEHLLDAMPPLGAQPRSAVLIGAPTDRPVPLALRGSLRIPWGDPRDDTGVLGRAWHEGKSGSGVQEDGRRLVAVPLRNTRGDQIGVVVADSLSDTGDHEDPFQTTVAVVSQHQGLVAVALAFGGLRERAGIEERERLARHIHDGIAQELVALGFRVDRLKRLPDDQLRSEAVEVRGEVSRILADVRSHIGDLRLTVRPEGGLGAAITSQLQVFGAVTGADVTLRLSESPFRLPAHVETGLYRIFLDFLADARRSGTPIEMTVTLRSQAPDAQLFLSQSGSSTLTESELSNHLPRSARGAVTVASTGSGTEISVRLTASETTPVLDERLPQAS